ncbi:MAG: histidine phosphatase family protein [Rhodobacterales bacterium]|nr:MAG: histidine phosphatase family protein [Rhodobacterales bacterium]
MYPELIVIRHGQTRWNLEGRWQGWRDSPLTARGEEQARAMAEILSREGITAATHKAFVSPLGRARATARLVLGEDWAATPDDRLREIGVGGWEGWLVSDIEKAAGQPDDAAPFAFYDAAPGGEGIPALHDRVRDFLDSLTGPSVLITHGICSRMIRTLATGRTLDRFDELPGGQGVVFRVRDGGHEMLTA